MDTPRIVWILKYQLDQVKVQMEFIIIILQLLLYLLTAEAAPQVHQMVWEKHWLHTNLEK